MFRTAAPSSQSSFFHGFEDSLDRRHPLFILAGQIEWGRFDEAFRRHYPPTQGRPCKPVRLMVGLLILKHLRDLSDESVVGQWAENNYYQHFCGGSEFTPREPCEASELVHFRDRVGEEGMGLIFAESVRVNGEDAKERKVVIDTTVQEKAIAFPTDSRLCHKIVAKCREIAEAEGVETRQSYARTVKRLRLDQRFRNHPGNKAKARRADRRMKTMAGRLVRELERKLPAENRHREDLALFTRVLSQKRDSKGKVYSLHEPDVECIAKGKERKRYEFGNKVSLTRTETTGVVTGVKSFRNPYDGDTLPEALGRSERIAGVRPEVATCDKGYKGRREVGGTKIRTPWDKARNPYERRKLREAFGRRAAIEPVIGHVKIDHRLGRNFHKGIFGDAVNAMLAAAAFNFKRMMNKWRREPSLFVRLFGWLLSPNPTLQYATAA